jgi:hypothetical protein
MLKKHAQQVYFSICVICILAIMGIQTKWNFKYARLEENQIQQQMKSGVCNAFKSIQNDKNNRIQLHDCADLKNGDFELLAANENNNLRNVIDQELKSNNVNVPYRIDILAQDLQPVPNSAKTLTEQRAALNLDFPSVYEIMFKSHGIEMILSVILFIFIGIIQIKSLKGGTDIQLYSAYHQGFDNFYVIGSYTFDYQNQTLSIAGQSQIITKKESQVLKYLCQNRNRIVKRDIMLTELWGENDYFNGRSMDVFISKLRKYLSQDINISIKNIRGVGFVLQDVYQKR